MSALLSVSEAPRWLQKHSDRLFKERIDERSTVQQFWIHGPVEEVMSDDVFLPKSFTMVAKDCRGTSLLFRGVFVALGNRIIPKDMNMLNKSLPQGGFYD